MAAFAPFVTDPAERERLDAIIQQIVAALAPAAMPSPYELVDLALLRAYVAALVPDDDAVGGAALARALELFGKQGADVGLFGGAARIGWTVAHLTAGETADQVCAALDGALLRQDKKKLALKTETVRALARDELVGIRGAGFTDISCSCESCICSYWGNCGPSK